MEIHISENQHKFQGNEKYPTNVLHMLLRGEGGRRPIRMCSDGVNM